VRQVVQVVVRLAACCTTCCVDFCCGLAVGFRFVVDFNLQQVEPVEHRVWHITSIRCGCVVQHVVTTSCGTNPQQVEVMESGTNSQLVGCSHAGESIARCIVTVVSVVIYIKAGLSSSSSSSSVLFHALGPYTHKNT